VLLGLYFRITVSENPVVSDLSLCLPNHRTVQHPRERRRAWILSIGAIAIVIGTIVFGDHAPDPSKCDPGSSARFVVTQVTSPSTITPGCFGPGPKHSSR
jgi:hypothetical protein